MTDEVNELKATNQQKRMFFALCQELEIDKEFAKETAKNKYKLDSFADITKEDLSELIERMKTKEDDNLVNALVACFHTFSGAVYREEKPDEEYAPWLAKKLLHYFIIKERKQI